MRIFIVRHGECYTNIGGRMQSTTDLPLTDKGFAQAAAAGEYLRTLCPGGFTRALSSPLLRAKQTAGIILSNGNKITGGGGLEIVPDLHEMMIGRAEGTTAAERARLFPEINNDTALSKTAYPDGESFGGLDSRCVRFIAEYLAGQAADPTCPDDNILAVSHGITIRVLINRIMDKPAQCVNYLNWPDNTAVTEIDISGDGCRRIIRLHDRTHLTARGLGHQTYEKWGLFSGVDYLSV